LLNVEIMHTSEEANVPNLAKDKLID